MTVQWQRFATPGRDDEGGRCANTSRQEDWFDNVEEQDRFVEHASGFAQAPEARTRLVARARRRLWRCGGKGNTGNTAALPACAPVVTAGGHQ